VISAGLRGARSPLWGGGILLPSVTLEMELEATGRRLPFLASEHTIPAQYSVLAADVSNLTDHRTAVRALNTSRPMALRPQLCRT